MIFVSNIHAQALQFSHELLDLFLDWIASHVTQIFVAGAAEHFEDRSGKPICDCDFGFITRA